MNKILLLLLRTETSGRKFNSRTIFVNVYARYKDPYGQADNVQYLLEVCVCVCILYDKKKKRSPR